MRELALSWASSLELGWALLWRFLLIAIPLNLLVQQLPDEREQVGALLELIALIGSVTAAVHWLRVGGYRKKRLVLMERLPPHDGAAPAE